MDCSVEVSHHLFLRKGLEIVDVETLGLEGGAGMRGNKLVVHFGSDGEFC